MGDPLRGEDRRQMCYNAPKSHQLGWCKEGKDEISPNLTNETWRGRLIDVADYANPDRGSESILVRVDIGGLKDYFDNFNRAIGINVPNVEASDMVNFYEQGRRKNL